jgi:hypothetical protein
MDSEHGQLKETKPASSNFIKIAAIVIAIVIVMAIAGFYMTNSGKTLVSSGSPNPSITKAIKNSTSSIIPTSIYSTIPTTSSIPTISTSISSSSVTSSQSTTIISTSIASTSTSTTTATTSSTTTGTTIISTPSGIYGPYLIGQSTNIAGVSPKWFFSTISGNNTAVSIGQTWNGTVSGQQVYLNESSETYGPYFIGQATNLAGVSIQYIGNGIQHCGLSDPQVWLNESPEVVGPYGVGQATNIANISIDYVNVTINDNLVSNWEVWLKEAPQGSVFGPYGLGQSTAVRNVSIARVTATKVCTLSKQEVWLNES